MLLESKVDQRCRKCRSNHSRAYHCDGTGESRLRSEGKAWCAAFDPMPKKAELAKLNWRV
jgi:methionyl-tRNA synthetase